MDYIDQMRGVAAFAVVGFHSLNGREHSSLSGALAVAQDLFDNGWLGVQVFFALSGWCIAQRVASAYHRRENCIHFIADRAMRIYPTYWAALALTLAILAASSPFNGIPVSRNVPHGVFPWLVELTLLQPALGQGAVLMVSWTLFYELSFYGASAAALALRQLKVNSGALLLLGGAASLVVTWHTPSGLFRGFSGWPNFFVGVLAWWSVNRKPGAAWLAAVAATLFFLFSRMQLPGFVAAATALTLAVAGRNPPKNPRRLGRWLRALGAASYSIYLIHVSVESPFFNLAGRFVSPKSSAYISVWVAGVALAIASGFLLHAWVEAPCERWRHRLLKARGAAATYSA